jgi:serine/threonine-protein kinase RsbW
VPSGDEQTLADSEVQLSLRLSRHPRSVALARDVAGTFLRGLGVTRRGIDDLRLVISEACTNAVEYADPAIDYRLSLAVKGRRCLIEVRDAGRGFDPGALPDAMPAADAPSGRGVALMRYLTDELEFQSDPVSGTAVRMEKELSMERDVSPGNRPAAGTLDGEVDGPWSGRRGSGGSVPTRS